VSIEPFHLFRYLDEQRFVSTSAKGTAVSFRRCAVRHLQQASDLQGAYPLGVAANVLKKASPKSRAAVDVPADSPEGTMDRFTEGLRCVLRAPNRASQRAGPRDESSELGHPLHEVLDSAVDALRFAFVVPLSTMRDVVAPRILKVPEI